MVFYYTIRGGKCLHESSHIILKPDDIICYVGRDKHENEYLIQYGWPGDIWFHVDGLSSAHVYFRLKNPDEVSSIPIDDLPPDAVYDMMQICKNNSIAGCKLASCKMVYTPHSNLKKTFQMESGAVTYHNTKLCRYGRCEKDRQRVKELEKTKTEDIQVDYYQEMKDNERRIIERKKRMRQMMMQNNNDLQVYDPIKEDIRTSEVRATRQGDKESGLDVGLAALEGLSFGSAPPPSAAAEHEPTDDAIAAAAAELTRPDEPVWLQEHRILTLEPSEDVRFLCERGYTSSEAHAAWEATHSRIVALKQLYHHVTDDNDYLLEASSITAASTSSSDVKNIPEEVLQARLEEKEVLIAMFGEDGVAVFSDMEDEAVFDVSLPVIAYEVPDRYQCSLPLMLEVYADNGIAPLYPNEPPVLALVGGGLPAARVRYLTKRLRNEALERAKDEPGEPQIFNLLTFVGEEVESIVQQETAELEAERQKLLQEKRAAAATERAEAEKSKKADASASSSGARFSSDAERRAYAKDVVAKAGTFVASSVESSSTAPKEKKFHNTGVSDQSLINDLFGL